MTLYFFITLNLKGGGKDAENFCGFGSVVHSGDFRGGNSRLLWSHRSRHRLSRNFRPPHVGEKKKAC